MVPEMTLTSTPFQFARIPLLERRGGCGIKQKSRSHRRAADGVVAHALHFGDEFRNVACERPPLLCKEGNAPARIDRKNYVDATPALKKMKTVLLPVKDFANAKQ